MITFPPPRKSSAFGTYKAPPMPKKKPEIRMRKTKKPVIKVGQKITQIDFPFKSYKITKVGRKYAYVVPLPHLPGIDRPEKISFYRINLEFSAWSFKGKVYILPWLIGVCAKREHLSLSPGIFCLPLLQKLCTSIVLQQYRHRKVRRSVKSAHFFMCAHFFLIF